MSSKTIRTVVLEIAHDVVAVVSHDELQRDIMDTLIDKGYDIISSEITTIRERMLPDRKPGKADHAHTDLPSPDDAGGDGNHP